MREFAITQRWLDYWCGHCAFREYHQTVRMCSKPKLREDDFGQLRCTRYMNELFERVSA